MRRYIRLRRIALTCWALVFVAPIAEAIVVAPHHAFMDDRTRSGVLYLHNPRGEPEEISISFVFGYPVSDTAGGVSVQLIERPDPDAPTAAGWIRAFPRRAIVGPGQTRAVRLLAQPPKDLADGEYWARAIVTSRTAGRPPKPVDGGDVKVGLRLEVRTVIPVTYRNGEVTTGVVVTEVQREMSSDSLVTKVGLERMGNAAFLGVLHVTLVDPAGKVAEEAHHHVAVYNSLLKRVAVPVAHLSGDYVVHIRLDTQRSDIDPSSILPVEPVESSFSVRLP